MVVSTKLTSTIQVVKCMPF